MADRRPPRHYVAATAWRDLDAIIERSMSEFGEEAALRYETLVLQAVQDLFTDPNRPGSKDRSDILTTGARSYHISLSRSRTSAPRVKQPRHLLVYRRRQDGVVEVSRILHEGQDIRRHVPDEYLS